MSQTLFVWDLADTLFYQKWNTEHMQAADPIAWMAREGLDASTPLQYEKNFKAIFTAGTPVDLALMPDYAEVLSQTADNQAFTTGNVEQVDWRAEYLNPQVGFDIKKYFSKIVSTFEFAPTNLKTEAVIEAYLKREAALYKKLVYTDNDLANCALFYKVGQKYFSDVKIFHFKNDRLGVRPQAWYIEIGALTDLIEFFK